MITENEKKLYELLTSLGINFKRYEHPPLFSVEDAKKIQIDIPGNHYKNLFLRNRKGDTHYLVVVEDKKRVDLKLLEEQIVSTRLSFASEERLLKYLGVTPGSVTPYALMNDKDHSVMVLVDSDIRKASLVNFHPTINTATIGVSFEDFEKFLKWTGNEFKYVEI